MRRLLVLFTLLLSCRAPESKKIAPQGASQWREVPGFASRPYFIHLPKDALPSQPIPAILVLHGGGGNADNTNKMTCDKGDMSSPSCITALADQENFAVVFPNGTSSAKFAKLRTWNAGGGKDGFQCVSGDGCKTNVDDIAYFNALLSDLSSYAAIDQKRIFATGLSNGAAMSHRLACELSDKIAAVAPVAGGNQFAATAACAPKRPVPIMHIHGTSDPCWPYNGGTQACLQYDGGKKVSVEESIAGWFKRNKCSEPPTTTELPKATPDDGTSTQKIVYSGCAGGADVVLYSVNHGGHTWPQGNPYLSEKRVGLVSHTFSANLAMWEFFQQHPMP